MSKKRAAGIALLGLGGLAAFLGAEGLERGLAAPGRGAALVPLAGGAILLGLIMMIVGGILLARSFLEL
jgi:hypothetical protein